MNRKNTQNKALNQILSFGYVLALSFVMFSVILGGHQWVFPSGVKTALMQLLALKAN